MRISERKRFLWQGLCLLPQGTTRSLGTQDCHRGGYTQRAEMHRAASAVGQGKPASGSSTGQHNRAGGGVCEQGGGTKGCPAWNQGSQVLTSTFVEHNDFSRPGIRVIPTLRSMQHLGSPASESGVGGRKKYFWDWVQLYQLIAGEGSTWRPGCSVQASCVPAKLAINYWCCHANQVLLRPICLFHLCEPALSHAFAFRSAATAEITVGST